MHRLPAALFIGADKAGSTWLHTVAASHPDIYVPSAKDTYFFSDDDTYARGLGWYEGFFARSGDDQLPMEICHDYMHSPHAAKRIRATLGHSCRMIATLRKPSSRAISAYLNARKHGQIRASFEEAVTDYPFLTENARYGTFLRRYLRFFPKDAFLVLDFESLQRSPSQYWCEIARFLGIDPRLDMLTVDRIVQPAMDPRSMHVTYAAKLLGTWARGRGLAGLVGAVKGNSIIQAILYRESDRGARASRDFPTRLLNHIDESLLDEVRMVDQDFGTSFVKSWYLADSNGALSDQA